jgi:NAD(P)-dependent dehydrogenase (short-subunit alcohol dehydrogenase family)
LDNIKAQYGAVDALVNADYADNLLMRMKDDEWNDIIGTNSIHFKKNEYAIRAMMQTPGPYLQCRFSGWQYGQMRTNHYAA